MSRDHSIGTDDSAGPLATELLVLENDILRLTMWPRMGGKIISLRLIERDLELLHPPLHTYSPATATSSFEASDAGGWDECFPSVAPCVFGAFNVPDHGELWRKSWNAQAFRDRICAAVESSLLPLRFSRQINLHQATLRCDYAVENTNHQSASWLWSAHPLFQVEAGDRIVLPTDVQTVRVEDSSQSELAASDSTCTWPLAKSFGSNSIDLSYVGAEDGATYHKLFAGPVEKGWCGLYRSQLQTGIVMRFDPERTPFVGLWISQGAWPAGSGGPRQ